MSSTYKMFKTDQALESGGVTINYGDFSITIARAGGSNKAYQRALEKKTRPFRRAIQSDTFTNDQAMAVLREVYVETVILGWDGVTDENDNPIPFTKENCLKLFTDLPDLFSDLMQQASNITLFREDVREEDSKN